MAALDKFARLAALKPVRVAPARPSELRAPQEEDALARLLGAGIGRNHFGEHVVVRNWYSTPAFDEPSPLTLDLLSRHRDDGISSRTRCVLTDPAKWLFLDTETTGLAGGTGTYPFLVGLAWWDAGGLNVEQFLMRDFSEEHSVLQELAQRIAERPALITFNGKTFDWPLLENRFAMTRSIPTPRLAAHLDLLHPARSLWKFRLGSVRLSDLERHVLDPARLGWTRDDDIRSAEIPQFYFDYLRGGPPGPLAGVVRHNQMDLRGLAALFGKIDALLSSGNAADICEDSLDLFGLSRFLNHRGEADRAQFACAQALDSGLPAEFRPKARRELALHARRRGDHERAAALWQEITADPEHGIYACEQLAIHYERRVRNYERAAEFVELALATIRRRRSNGDGPLSSTHGARLEKSLQKRRARLQNRIAGAQPSKQMFARCG